MEKLTTKITGDQKIAGFVEIYNKNNENIEKELSSHVNEMKLIKNVLSNKVNSSYIDKKLEELVNLSISSIQDEFNHFIQEFRDSFNKDKVEFEKKLDQKIANLDLTETDLNMVNKELHKLTHANADRINEIYVLSRKVDEIKETINNINSNIDETIKDNNDKLNETFTEFQEKFDYYCNKVDDIIIRLKEIYNDNKWPEIGYIKK